MQPVIRPFTSADYAAIVAIANAVNPEHPATVEEVLFDDEHEDPKCKHQRWVAEVAGRVVGVGEYGQMAGMFHPRKFRASIAVEPEHQGRGIGTALYEHLLTALQPFDPLSLRMGAREDMTRGLRFLHDRGFREDMRTWESRLDVAAFDPAPFSGVVAGVATQGVEITTLAALAGDPERDRKLYEIEVEIDHDVPTPEPFTPVSYEHFVQRGLGDPNLLSDGYFVATHHGIYVGQSTLWKSQANSDLYVGLTGVKREYRRKGIALALKLRAIAFAQNNGYRQMKTWNESNNRPMLAINERLGFVKQPAWISFVKVLKEEEP